MCLIDNPDELTPGLLLFCLLTLLCMLAGILQTACLMTRVGSVGVQVLAYIYTRASCYAVVYLACGALHIAKAWRLMSSTMMESLEDRERKTAGSLKG